MRKPFDASASKPAALLLSPENFHPPAGGGALRTASVAEYLRQRYRLDLITFREADAPPPAFPEGALHRILAIELPRHGKRPLSRAWRNAWRLARGVAPLEDRFRGFARPVAEFVRGQHYHVGVIEHSWCAPYLPVLAEDCGRVVLDLHNVESALYAGLAASAGPALSLAWKRFSRAAAAAERRWLPGFSHVLAASEADAARVRRLVPGCPADWFPNSVPLVPQPAVARSCSIVFSGNLDYPPNRDAVSHFARHGWPELRFRRPGLVWRIIGKNPGAVRRWDGNGVDIVGPVADAVPELARSSVAIVPLLAGSGTRIKILEAWAAGIPVVSTPAGAEGLPAQDGEHLLIAAAGADFAAAVLRLLDDPALRDRIGGAGRRLYEREFTWESAWKRLETLGL